MRVMNHPPDGRSFSSPWGRRAEAQDADHPREKAVWSFFFFNLSLFIQPCHTKHTFSRSIKDYQESWMVFMTTGIEAARIPDVHEPEERYTIIPKWCARDWGCGSVVECLAGWLALGLGFDP